MLLIVSWEVFILLIWFQGEVQNYFNFRPLSNWLKLDKYLFHVLKNEISYPKFLSLYYSNFFTNLIGCPLCLSTWLSIILSLIFLRFVEFPIVLICSLILFYLISLLKKVLLGNDSI